jgi:hypothetical protein
MSPATKASSRKGKASSPARKAASTKTKSGAAKKASSRKATAKKAVTKKTPPKKAAPKKVAAKKSAGKAATKPKPVAAKKAPSKPKAAAPAPKPKAAAPAPKPKAAAPAPKPKAAAPAPKPKAAVPAPKPRKKRSPKAILAEATEILDRIYGPITLPATSNTLEKAVYLVLREGGTELTTTKAMKSLKAEFVDWNEVRVSRSSELARLMSGTSKMGGIRRFHERSTRLREMIDQIYGDRNEPSLEFLNEERPKAQLEYLEDFDDLGLHNAYALVQWLSEKNDLVLVSHELAKAAHILGLVESAAVTKVKKSLGDMLNTHQERVSMQAHLNKLGELEPEQWPTAMKEMLH